MSKLFPYPLAGPHSRSDFGGNAECSRFSPPSLIISLCPASLIQIRVNIFDRLTPMVVDPHSFKRTPR
jgi:hypothetical protein